ncbi:MAG TPA: hypothetical protein VLX91_00905 [Candidatus Acidoferrales bacterium]|nr:hypothetical protein [Candidatus Acidoferrales bacterium]
MADLTLTISLLSSTFCFTFLSGCNIFQTRTPQQPQQGQSDFIPPTSSDIVIQNLKSAVAEKNVDNYLSCLSDTNFGGRKFTFVPAVNISSQYAQIFANWDKDYSERTYFSNLAVYSSATASPALTLSSENYTSLSSDSVKYTANYILLWPNSASGSPQQAEGNLQFFLGVDRNQNWSVYRWIDTKLTDSLPTWSEMKAKFSQ